MAEVVTIKGSTATAKIRNPIGVVALSIVTIGIYFFFWYYYINRELAEYGKVNKTDECGDSPSTSLLAMALGWIIIVPPFVSIFNCINRMNAAVRLSKADNSGVALDAVLGLVLWIVLAPAVQVLIQLNLNRVWEKAAK